MGFSSQEEFSTPAPEQAGSPGGAPSLIPLQPLHPQDPLRHKWQLGAGLPPASEQHWQQHDAEQQKTGSQEGLLHLREWHGGEDAWECHIPVAELARESGIVLGRCPQEADIMLPHESISRRHALLEIAENGLVITDLSSTNGTSVNEHMLSAYDRRVPLPPGSALTLGEVALRVEYIH